MSKNYTGLENNSNAGSVASNYSNSNASNVGSVASTRSIPALRLKYPNTYNQAESLQNRLGSRNAKENRNAIIQKLVDNKYTVKDFSNTNLYIAALEAKYVRNLLCDSSMGKNNATRKKSLERCKAALEDTLVKSMIFYKHLKQDHKEYGMDVDTFWRQYGPNVLDKLHERIEGREAKSRPTTPTSMRGGRRTRRRSHKRSQTKRHRRR